MVVPPNWARKDIAHEVRLFGQGLQIAFFCPEFDLVTGASWEFHDVSRSVQSQFFNFP